MSVPRVSVVIPTYKRLDLLERCLEALARQTLAREHFEVIVADDGNDPGLKEALEAWHPHLRLRYVTPFPRKGPAAARNTGWQSARAALIAFTDDDTVPDAGWLLAGLRAFEADERVAGPGRVVVPTPRRPTDHERDTLGLAHAEFVTANCFVRRRALEAIGGFDERFTAAWREDSDLQFRLLQQGPIRRIADAVVEHPVRPAPWGFSLRQQKKSRFNALLYKKHPRLYRDRIQRLPPLHYYGIAGAAVVAATALALQKPRVARGAASAWALLTAGFTLRRLRGASLTPAHVTEMAATSLAIPFLSLYWRLRGAVEHRVFFL